ncbi:SHOCT domain-containing protein [Phycicoccus sp. M110.8]|uniref:SHOCT domain-containing protein n=1 Tax=Phycicoccus sp. M110.8 TaxID=3075433 RepID=UPI0028FDA884|nr:SHOCT domain-containing protein [Phycicoccus sp. M110.8]MDU0315281.1 SHOCT domain-containing protein [Phycicoccus sp. M110.8]
MTGWYAGTGWGTWLVMVLVMVAFWTLVVVGIVALLRWTAAPRTAAPRTAAPPPAAPRQGAADAGGRPAPDAARALLDERLARGDIDEAEYRSRLATLRSRA